MKRGELKERMTLLTQESERRRRLSKVRRDTLRRIMFVRKKAVIETHEVYQLVRDFFKEFLEKRYEFTIEELRAELSKIYISNNTREEIKEILNKLHALEYSNVNYSHAELASILDKFNEIVKHLVKMHVKSPSLWQKLKLFIFKQQTEPEVIIAELPALEKNDSREIRIKTLVEKCYVALDKHNIRRAKSAYQVLLDEYGSLDMETQKQNYPLIDQTYKDILSRTEMSK